MMLFISAGFGLVALVAASLLAATLIGHTRRARESERRAAALVALTCQDALAAGRTLDVVTLATRHLADHPDDLPVRLLLAQAHQARGETALANAALTELLSREPLHSAASELIARLNGERPGPPPRRGA